jgi:hypothetical protein
MTAVPPVTNEQNTSADFANELRESVIGIELMKGSISRQRKMCVRHRDEVAEHFGASRDAVGGSRKLYAPKQPEIKAIAAVLGSTRSLWEGMTYSYRKGVRLLPKDRLPLWTTNFTKQQAKLATALCAADANYNSILAASRAHLGAELFNRDDYPLSFRDSITIAWGTFNFEPSDELLKLAPQTYAREQERVRRSFEGAVAAFEEESRDQLLKLVESLLDKLKAAENGEKVVYTESATTNLREFFDRFGTLNIRSDAALTALVDQAKSALGNTSMQDLKKAEYRRKSLTSAFEAVSSKLESLITNAPTRSIDLESLE